MKERDRRIADAVGKKAAARCPGSLDLLGVYGSAVTGDDYAQSDVDLLIVVNDERGRQLADCFILEDTGVGYDLYCTSWASLEEDADCPHAHLAKLLDAELLYCRDRETGARLEGLRKRAADILASERRFDRAERLLRQAKQAYAEVWLTEELSRVRTWAGETVYWLLDALMLYHGRYFRLGVKRTFAELRAAGLPFDAEKAVTNVLLADSPEEIRPALTKLFITAMEHMQFPTARRSPSAESLAGTGEEMVSNWRNKMTEAARRGDVFSSFMNLGSLQQMLHALAEEAGTEDFEIMDRFDPYDLTGNAAVFDAALERYSGEYARLGMKLRRFPDLDAFLAEYLSPPDRG